MHARTPALSVASLACLLGALGGTARTAHAQNAGSQAAAQALFEEARALMTAGKYAEACPKFAESERLDPGAGTLLNLANCYEKDGKTASAWVTFKDAAAAADVKHRADWSQRARERALALEPVLSRLIVEVTPAARVAGIEVRRDGVAVGLAEWGTPIPVDPGEHVIDAMGPRKKPWSARVTVGPKGDKASVTVPALEDEAVAVAVVAPSSPAPPSTDDGVISPAPRRDGKTQRTAGLVVGGVGLAGLAVGSVFGVIALGKASDAKRLCPSEPSCSSADGVTANDDAKSAATVSTAAMIAGGAALVAGAALFLTAPRDREAQARRVHITPIIGMESAGAAIGGAW
jgi:hypothetical protein